MRSFFSTPRRYDFPIPSYEATELPNKCQHLNNIIKKLLLMYLSEIPVEDDYRISGNTLYTLNTDAVAGSTLTITAGRGTVEGSRLTLQ